jgi:phage/plasmid-associated DNA primase
MPGRRRYSRGWWTGGNVTLNVKHKEQRVVRLNTRFIFASNKVPRFADKSNGIYRRFIPIEVTAVVPDGKRIYGVDKPSWWVNRGEMPGVLNWALDGLARLRGRYWHFEIPEVIKTRREEIRLENDPARDYIHKRWQQSQDPTMYQPSDRLYKDYKAHEERAGRKPESDAQFAQAMRNEFPGIIKKNKKLKGNVFNDWFGIEPVNETSRPRGPGALTPAGAPEAGPSQTLGAGGPTPEEEEELLELQLAEAEGRI